MSNVNTAIQRTWTDSGYYTMTYVDVDLMLKTHPTYFWEAVDLMMEAGKPSGAEGPFVTEVVGRRRGED